VLIVCSDAAKGRVIEETIRGWSLDTVVCCSLQEARTLMSEQDMALVFCDENLEDGTYGDLLTVMAHTTRKIPIVIMISDTDEDWPYREAMAQGAFDVIATPCSKQDVQWLVIRALGLTYSPRVFQ
jgi:DNA-binding NtrC family response regulator